jgi:hypothetical protein
MLAALGHTSLLAMHILYSGSVRGNGTEVSCERDRWIYMGDIWTRETDGHIWETDGHIWETDEYVRETVS